MNKKEWILCPVCGSKTWTTGKHYNIEVQKKPEGAHIRRARFNSSMMDSRMLKEGQEF